MQHRQGNAAIQRLARFAIALCLRPANLVAASTSSSVFFLSPSREGRCGSSHSPAAVPASAPLLPLPYHGTFSSSSRSQGRMKRSTGRGGGVGAAASMEESLPPRKPRVVIVGAGMAGIAAAQRLQQGARGRYELTILEASDRIGGRICSSEFNGENVELGATWIHGIEGSPLFKTAIQIGAMENAERAWEGKDGFLGNALLKAEGGLDVAPELVEPVVECYKHLLQDAQEMGVVQAKEMVAGSAIDAAPLKISDFSNCVSLGAYLQQGLERFLAQQVPDQGAQIPRGGESLGSPWTTRSLQEGVFRMHENLERNITSANDVNDIDLVDYNEYWEFPGEHRTIGKGYSSVVHSFASSLPSGSVQFGKKVEKIVWNDSAPYPGAPVNVHCEGGLVVEADHVIVTVSLGILKEKTLGTLESRSRRDNISASNLTLTCPRNIVAETEEPHDAHKIEESSDQKPAAPTPELFDPPLPMWKLDSISRLGFGVVDKVFVQIQPAEEGGKHRPLQFIFDPQAPESSDVPAWIRKTYSLYPIHEKSHALVAWFAGDEALQVESVTDEEILSGISKTLANFGIPESQQGTFLGIHRSKWGQNPLFRGSYSYVKVGSTGDDIDALAEPLPKLGDGGSAPLQVLFAGEATHRHYYSTTHGAYFSGLREAERLLQHYGLLT